MPRVWISGWISIRRVPDYLFIVNQAIRYFLIRYRQLDFDVKPDGLIVHFHWLCTLIGD